MTRGALVCASTTSAVTIPDKCKESEIGFWQPAKISPLSGEGERTYYMGQAFFRDLSKSVILGGLPYISTPTR